MPAPPALLTVSECARLCSCNRRTILDAIARGRLTAMRLGERGHYRIRRVDLYDWLDSSRPPVGSERR